MVTNEEKWGSWVEYIGTYEAKETTLGIRTSENGETEVIPVTPGMILTIDKASYSNDENDETIFHRVFAPVAPHTTSKEGRDCLSCHNNPVALGYGEGELSYSIESGSGRWKFESTYANNSNDGLPGDSWIGFMQNRTGTVSTRTDVSPFTIEQQQKILTVGACLTCHDQDSEIMTELQFKVNKL